MFLLGFELPTIYLRDQSYSHYVYLSSLHTVTHFKQVSMGNKQ